MDTAEPHSRDKAWPVRARFLPGNAARGGQADHRFFLALIVGREKTSHVSAGCNRENKGINPYAREAPAGFIKGQEQKNISPKDLEEKKTVSSPAGNI